MPQKNISNVGSYVCGDYIRNAVWFQVVGGGTPKLALEFGRVCLRDDGGVWNRSRALSANGFCWGWRCPGLRTDAGRPVGSGA